MKKIIYFLAVVGLVTVVACSDEDTLPTVNYTGCQVCEVAGVGPDFIPEDYEVCTALHTFEMDTTLTDTIDNPVELTYETIYVDGADTRLGAVEYFQLFCDNDFDPNYGEGGTNCVTCAAFAQNNTQFPAEEVCVGTNGNAFANGVDTGKTMAVYIAERSTVTTCQ